MFSDKLIYRVMTFMVMSTISLPVGLIMAALDELNVLDVFSPSQDTTDNIRIITEELRNLMQRLDPDAVPIDLREPPINVPLDEIKKRGGLFK